MTLININLIIHIIISIIIAIIIETTCQNVALLILLFNKGT